MPVSKIKAFTTRPYDSVLQGVNGVDSARTAPLITVAAILLLSLSLARPTVKIWEAICERREEIDIRLTSFFIVETRPWGWSFLRKHLTPPVVQVAVLKANVQLPT